MLESKQIEKELFKLSKKYDKNPKAVLYNERLLKKAEVLVARHTELNRIGQ